MSNHHQREDLTVHREEAVLAGVSTPESPIDDYPEPMSELRGLAQAAGARVVGGVTQKRMKPDVATYIGKGKIEELSRLIDDEQANVVIVDDELHPAQVRNLEKQTHTKVVDRTELILDIFATRAQTEQAKLQVELAQLEYLRPRLKRLWTHLETQGGGIGTRGPGETQLETDRRLIDRRIRELRDRLSIIKKRKEREVQARQVEFRVSLVGYTNAGKSTLMRALTKADVLVADMLFATLDTRTRRWAIPGWGKVLLSDTVGFIRKLPHDLVESFKATLEEAVQADLLLHVVNAADPHAIAQYHAVLDVLEEIGAREKPTVLVLNQIDEIRDRTVLNNLESLHPHAVAISAQTGEGLEQLCAMVVSTLSHRYVEAEVEFHAGNGRLRAYFGAHGQIGQESYDDDNVRLKVRMARHLLDRVQGEVRILSAIQAHPDSAAEHLR
ncbi:GTPase HflX [bacterium]|nr:GTPase HflX [bacterium]